jgi:hypothetical protein
VYLIDIYLFYKLVLHPILFHILSAYFIGMLSTATYRVKHCANHPKAEKGTELNGGNGTGKAAGVVLFIGRLQMSTGVKQHHIAISPPFTLSASHFVSRKPTLVLVQPI